MTLATFVKKARKKAGLSLREAADISGISHTNISALEHGDTENPTVDTIKELSAALGVEAVDMFKSAL